MILMADAGCYLTQSAETPIAERLFGSTTYISNAAQAAEWMQVTEAEKYRMETEGTIFDPSELDGEYLEKVSALMDGIAKNINAKTFSAEQALEYKDYYPVWGSDNAPMGTAVEAGFRFTYAGTLYEVIQEHTLQADWIPGTGTESLYKVVQVEHAGTLEDPVPYTQGMAFTEGTYYVQDGVTYLCILTTVTGYPNDLKDLPTIVQPADV